MTKLETCEIVVTNLIPAGSPRFIGESYSGDPHCCIVLHFHLLKQVYISLVSTRSSIAPRLSLGSESGCVYPALPVQSCSKWQPSRRASRASLTFLASSGDVR